MENIDYLGVEIPPLVSKYVCLYLIEFYGTM